MKRLFQLLLLFWINPASTSFAFQDPPKHLLQAHWDDDYINFYGNGTDKAYTSGTRISFFYVKKKSSRSLIERILPKAGDSSLNVFGFGLTQMIFTPDDISNPDFQPDDYPWSGFLYITHSLYSFNAQHTYNFQTELDIGVNGPASMARQAQKIAHRFVNYQEPKGWDNQFGNSLIINLNFRAEKQVLCAGKSFEVIGGGELQTGTGINAAAVYSLVRIGKMNPYFQGLITQYGRSGTKQKIQLYMIFKSKVQWVLSNSMLQGGINASRPAPNPKYYPPISNIVASYAYGPVVAIDRFSISSILTKTTPFMKGLYGLTWGNFTLTYIF